MPENAARFVSVARFAELVGLSERTCWNLIRTQRIPSYRVGRRTLVKTEEGFRAIERLGRGHNSAERTES